MIAMMRVFHAKSPRWAIRHIYVFMALAGFAIIALLYAVTYLTPYVLEIDVSWLLFEIAGGLILISAILAIGYYLIRRGVTLGVFKAKDPNVT
jgi:hypothetical protein